VQVPAQPLLLLGAGVDEVVAVVREQPDVERPSVQVRSGEVLDSLAQRRPGHAEGVDRVGLAALPGRAASARHVLGRDPHDPLAAGDEEALEGARHVPAVLERPDPLAIEPAGPPQELAEASLARRRRQLPAGAGGEGVDRRAGVGLLVRVRADHDHVHRPFNLTTKRTPADTSHSGPMPSSYQVTPAVLGRRRATQHRSVTPTGRQKVNESARRRPENQPQRSDVTAQTQRL
jgi:hypothetical protein